MSLSPLVVLQSLDGVPPFVIYTLSGVLGAIIGSFLNVVIHRVPREESIVFPNSRCPSCGATIAFYDNIPVLSYALLGGKCRGCGKHISARYPAVELFSALLFMAITWHTGLTPALPFDLIFAAAIVALIFIDAEHMILPNVVTYPGMVFALVARLAIPYLSGRPHFDDIPSLIHGTLSDLPLWAISLTGGLVGALIGGGSLWLMGWTWEKLRGIEAMGLGDVKMMFMVGAYLGWRLTILTIFLAVFLGSIVGIMYAVVKWKQTAHFDLQIPLPFGVFLGLGSITALLLGTPIVERYLELSGFR